ncbi:hypothetical protein [Flavobacterium sp.]|uniref:hypothetical protein n=1 Tax=Flavobacterium sp. TaxID=239 RepID=UPI00286E95E6|nr:hypothetical protein [Flavobacterium sp.]
MLKNVFLGISILFVLIYFSASILYDTKYVVYIKPVIIPAFICYAFCAFKERLNSHYLIFVFFFYAGEIGILFMEQSPIMYKFGLLFYFFSYLSLINLAYPYIKFVNLIKEIKLYSFFIFLLLTVLLVFILKIIFDSEIDFYLNTIIVLNALSAIFLVVTAFILLQEIFNRKTVYYFFGVFCIFFSDVISAVNFYLLDDFYLNLLERVLHFSGFFLFYLFIIQKEENKFS